MFPINNQDELNKVISERIAREKGKLDALEESNAALKTQLEEANSQISILSENSRQFEKSKLDLEGQISDLNAKIKGYERDSVKMKVALEANLPYTFAERLRGESEEEIRQDAMELAGLLKPRDLPPTRSQEEPERDPLDASLINLARQISQK